MTQGKITNRVDVPLNTRRLEASAIALLGILLGILALFRAGAWFDVARQTEGKGIFLIPLTEIIVLARGWLVVLVAALYFVFAIGAFLQRRWARILGLFLAIITIVTVLTLIPSGLISMGAIALSILSALLIFYLLSARGRRMFGR
jgi:hypothetical protein